MIFDLKLEAPIGIFDSGLGGLAVLREVRRLLPNEDVLFVGDTARQPYGPQPVEDVRRYATEIAGYLGAQGAKIVVIACNTASVAGLEAAQRCYPDLPVLILSSKPKDESVRRAYNAKGGRAFLPKDSSVDDLQEMIWHHALLPDDSGEIVGYSVPLLTALRNARNSALTRRNVLIRGESGTGKELLARYIHRLGKNAPEGQLVTVDSSVLTQELFQGELYGVEPDTATGVAGLR